MLQYNHLDDGLYLTTHTVPQEKYFVRLNVHLDEMRSELDRAVREAVPDYVLVGWDELPAEFDRYQLIATDVGYDDSNRLNKMAVSVQEEERMKKRFRRFWRCCARVCVTGCHEQFAAVRDQLLDGYEYLFHHRAGHDARADAVSGFV